MAVRIRMKKLGRRHRPYYRICAMDSKSPRGGRVLQELGTYDPMVPYTDARVTLDGAGVDAWIKKGAQPTPKVAVLIKKYGLNGTHLKEQADAQAKLAEERKPRPNIRRVYVAPSVAAPVEKAPAPAKVVEEAPAEVVEEVVEVVEEAVPGAEAEAPAEEAASDAADAE